MQKKYREDKSETKDVGYLWEAGGKGGEKRKMGEGGREEEGAILL